MSPGCASRDDGGADRRAPSSGRALAVAVGAQPCDQRVAADALDRRLAGGIDIGDDHGVGVVEAGAELVEQAGKPRVAVRLHHGDDLARASTARAAFSTAAISTG